MANQTNGTEPGPDAILEDTLRDNPQLTMQFFANFWDTLTHCAEPDNYHEITEKLQGALRDDSIKAAPTTEASPETSAGDDPTAVPVSPKQMEWEDLGVYRIQLDQSGSPILDSDWPTDFRFVKEAKSEGDGYFQLFKSETDATIVDTTDPNATKYALPELRQGTDDDTDHYVYRFGRRYRFGPKAYNAEGKYISKPFMQLESFDYAEHLMLGNKVQLQWSDTVTTPAFQRPLKLENGVTLTYGDINALGGDFFATMNPICMGSSFQDQCARFKQAFETLDKSSRAVQEVPKIQAANQPELNAIGTATQNGTTTADTGAIYAKLDETVNKNHVEDKALDDATRRPNDPSYMAIAQLNLDHFGADGRTAYNAGHYCALQAASSGNLELAYAMNAFADHFLGDAFASGHFRTPRRKLHGSPSNVQGAVDTISKIVLGNDKAAMVAALAVQIFNPRTSVYLAFDSLAPDFCSKFMHQEDNVLGLWLTNKRGDKWQVFGDTKMFDPGNALNCKFMLQGLQTSVSEVYEAFKAGSGAPTKDPSTYGVWNIAPSAEIPGSNHQPLFRQDGWYRSPINDPKSKSYTDPTPWYNKGYKLLAIDLFSSDYFSKLQ